MTASSIITVGMFLHGGIEGLADYTRKGGSLPFNKKWGIYNKDKFCPASDMEMVSAWLIVKRLRDLI